MILGSFMVAVNARGQQGDNVFGSRAAASPAAVGADTSLSFASPIFQRPHRVVTPDGTPPLCPRARCGLLQEIRGRMREHVRKACDTDEWRVVRGRPAEVLEGRKHFLTKTVKAVHAIPNSEDIASNYGRLPKAESLYFINGMTSSPADVKTHVDNLLKIKGRPIAAVINGQEKALFDRRSPGVARAVWNATQGFVSFKKGRAVEQTAAQELERALVDHVKNEHPLHIVAHSQGTIILRNALEHVLGKNSPLDERGKAQLKSLLRVSTYGAAEHYFPVGISVQEFAHREDPIVKITGVLAEVRQGFRSVVTAIARSAEVLPRPIGKGVTEIAKSVDSEVPLQKAPTVYLRGEHGFVSYVERMAEFFIEKHGPPDRLRGARLAQGLVLSINRGDFSDNLHDSVIEKLIQQGDRRFAKEFLHRVNGEMIGLYRVPFMDELKKLAK